MAGWMSWLLWGLLAWVVVSASLGLLLARILRLSGQAVAELPAEQAPEPAAATHPLPAREPLALPRVGRRCLVVDDDAALRTLLRVTLTADEFVVSEAEDAERAAEIARFWLPQVIVLDVRLPGIDGLEFCSRLKQERAFGSPRVILLTGAEVHEGEAIAAGADALVRKPFGPLELVSVIDRLTGEGTRPLGAEAEEGGEQLLLYARDLARLLEIERSQRRLLESAYRQTVGALASALEAKDSGTGAHASRVQRYALDLADGVDSALLADPSLEYGFFLHDIGKLGVPEHVLRKPGPLTPAEQRLIERHPLLGAEMLAEIAFLQGEGIQVVRSHHERWDGAGYPDELKGQQIPLGARIFAVADTLDAMTSDRPYRRAGSWHEAAEEIRAQSGRQFDPDIVGAFVEREDRLYAVYRALGVRAA